MHRWVLPAASLFMLPSFASTHLPMEQQAIAFLSTLTTEQRAKAVYAADSENLRVWQFVPADRIGIKWDEMNPKQKEAAKNLLETSLSEEGYQKIESIRALEPVLKALENGNPGRDENRYWFVFFGDPSQSGKWAWRYEGHHVSLTFGMNDSKVIASTPQFLGTNPAEVRSGAAKGKRVQSKEMDSGFAFLNSLREEQKQKAIISEKAPDDVLTGQSRKASIQAQQGLKFDELDSKQKESLKKLVELYANIQSSDEKARRMKSIAKEGWNKVLFAWMGADQPGKGHYYRIQSENWIIEYDNTQNNANHIHTVWRNLKEDFGGDPLEKHYKESHHHHHQR
jgi:hypothetical protein